MRPAHAIEITHIFVSTGHNFAKQKDRDPERFPARDLAEAKVVKDAGLEGDRFYTADPDFDGHVTFFQQEVHDELVKALRLPNLGADRYRRNICVAGFDINDLIGKEFTIGGLKFRGTRKAEPCKWMNVSVHPEAEAFLKGRGEIRAQVLSTGILRKGKAELALAKTDGP